MRRGDLISVALVRDYGKPRPAIVVQSDDFEQLQSVTVVPLTSDALSLEVFRVRLEPSEQNGLRLTSQVMIDKIATLPRGKTGTLLAMFLMRIWRWWIAPWQRSSVSPDQRVKDSHI